MLAQNIISEKLTRAGTHKDTTKRRGCLMSKIILECRNVSFRYLPEKAILEDVTLKICEHEFISIIGPSGSGKSTLFRLITGLEQPTTGAIFLQGKKVENRLGQVGYMPQQDLLLPWKTIIDNALLPLKIKGAPHKEAVAKVTQMLEQFGLEQVAHRYPSELSGGMKQRVSFLRTMLTGSELLLLDEPFSALDAITKLSMQEWLMEQWAKWKKTILYITHDVEEALFLSDRILVFKTNNRRELKEVIVPMKRPRTYSDINQKEIIALKAQLIEELRKKDI